MLWPAGKNDPPSSGPGRVEKAHGKKVTKFSGSD